MLRGFFMPETRSTTRDPTTKKAGPPNSVPPLSAGAVVAIGGFSTVWLALCASSARRGGLMQDALWGPPQPPRRRGRPTRRARFDRALGILAFYADAHGGFTPTSTAAVPRNPHMWIFMGDDDWKDPWLQSAGRAARCLYWDCLSWAKDQTRGRDISSAISVMGDLESWFIPDATVRGWKATREAKELVEVGIWTPVQGGYRYLHLRDENKPKVVAEKRSKNTRKQRSKRGRALYGSGAECATGEW